MKEKIIIYIILALIIISQVYVVVKLNFIAKETADFKSTIEGKVFELEKSNVLWHQFSDNNWKGFQDLTNQVIKLHK